MVVWLAGLLDLLGEPPNRYHPVAWFGRLAGALEARFYRPSAWRGALLALFLLALAFGLGAGLARAAAGLPPVVAALLLALFLKPTFALKGLLAAVFEVERALGRGLDEGRERLSRIVSRRVVDLGPAEVRMAAIESLAENLSDALVAPLFYYLLFGLPGAYLYRAANTLDAMWGYPTPRYRAFGRFSARADDLLNLVPARLTALLLLLPRLHHFPKLLREARRTPSPNAGWPMAATALWLGVRLEKRGAYVLNPGGRQPGPADLKRALNHARARGYLALLFTGLLAMGVGR